VFWAAARGSITAAGPGIDLAMPIGADGSAALPLVPAAAGPVSLRVTLDGQAVRAALGPPADLAASLAPFRGRVSAELDRLIANPTTWNVSVPLSAELNAVIAQPATTPLRVTARVLRRRTPPRLSLVEFRLNRPATRLLVEVGAVRSAGYVRLRRLRITGSRTVVRVKIPRRVPIKARIVLERRTRVASPN
jgi:hypothetical protein